MNTAHLLISSYDPFFPRSGNDNKWAHTARTRVPQGTSEHGQPPEGSGLSPQQEPSEGNNSPSASPVTDPRPSGWLAAESLKRPFPPSLPRTQVRDRVTHCFLRRTFQLFCQGPRTGGWLPRPGLSPAHAAHSPTADGCPRVSEQLSPSWAPVCQRRVEREGLEPQCCLFPQGGPTAANRGLPPELLLPPGLPAGPSWGWWGAGPGSPKYKREGHTDSTLAYAEMEILRY